MKKAAVGCEQHHGFVQKFWKNRPEVDDISSFERQGLFGSILFHYTSTMILYYCMIFNYYLDIPFSLVFNIIIPFATTIIIYYYTLDNGWYIPFSHTRRLKPAPHCSTAWPYCGCSEFQIDPVIVSSLIYNIPRCLYIYIYIIIQVMSIFNFVSPISYKWYKWRFPKIGLHQIIHFGFLHEQTHGLALCRYRCVRRGSTSTGPFGWLDVAGTSPKWRSKWEKQRKIVGK